MWKIFKESGDLVGLHVNQTSLAASLEGESKDMRAEAWRPMKGL